MSYPAEKSEALYPQLIAGLSPQGTLSTTIVASAPPVRARALREGEAFTPGTGGALSALPTAPYQRQIRITVFTDFRHPARAWREADIRRAIPAGRLRSGLTILWLVTSTPVLVGSSAGYPPILVLANSYTQAARPAAGRSLITPLNLSQIQPPRARSLDVC